MIGLVNYAKDPHSVELRELSVPEIGDEDVLFSVQGSYSHNWAIWEKVISLLASGKINLDLLLNRFSPLTEWQATFEETHSGQIVKGVLTP